LQTRIAIAAGIVSVLFTAGVLEAQSAEPLPSATQPAPANSPTLINQLGDPDPIVREQANKSLWSIGRPAEAALRDAAASDVPEISRRAKAILRDFTYGLYPDAPHEIFALLETYRNGDLPEKRIAIGSLAANLNGVAGLRVLMKLREDETDPNLKQMITQVLAPREHDVAVLMLADGQDGDVERMLENSSLESPGAAQDYAALLLLDGKLPQKLAAINAQAISARSAPGVVAMARAAGNSALARAAADASGGADLLNAVLVEQGDWKALATRLGNDGGKLEPAERLGYLCAYDRLAGNEPAYRKALKQLLDQAERTPEDYLACAEDLFLNDATSSPRGSSSPRRWGCPSSRMNISRATRPRSRPARSIPCSSSVTLTKPASSWRKWSKTIDLATTLQRGLISSKVLGNWG